MFGWQASSGPEQELDWQTPLKQARPEQHWPFAPQGEPATEQPDPPHTPSTHDTPAQHGTVAPAQLAPVARHCSGPQIPVGPHVPEQQAVSPGVHACPSGVHCCAWQVPSTQNAEQHCVAVEQGAPLV
jgi:hypothetical protein